MQKQEFIRRLHETGAIKFGEFTLKSGIVSPFYINLRDIISYPDMLEGVASLFVEEVLSKTVFDLICGVPYTALPIASVCASKVKKPLVFKRKEEKSYGLGGLIVGSYKKGDACVVLEDLITTGESVLENTEALESAGIVVRDVAVIIDRSADGGAALKKAGYQLHALLTLDEIVKVLREDGAISADMEQTIRNFLASQKSGEKKSTLITNPLTKKLRSRIDEKESNLVLSLDVSSSEKFFSILDKCAESIVMLKTHVDMIDDFTPDFIRRLVEYSQRYNFLIFEDRKFADIGSTVQKQFRSGVYKIADWAEYITVHMIVGEAILKGLFEGIENRSSFLLARMSAKGNLITEDYTRKVLEAGIKNERVVSGFIGHGDSPEDIRRLRNKIPEGMCLMMPGVQLGSTGDNLGQQYITPQQAVENGADCIIVGRGIIAADNVAAAASEYRKIAFDAYCRGRR